MDEVAKYEKYKPSGIDWIGDVPEHWKLKRFKNSARQVSDKKSLEVDSEEFIVALENIEGETGRYIETSSEYETSGIAFTKDHLLYNKLRPYLNKTYLAERDGICVGDIIVLQCLQVVPSFLKYLMTSDGFCSTVTASSFGTKMPRTSWEFISNMKFAWPETKEQERIVTFLNEKTQKLDTLITNKKVQVEKLKELRQIEINTAVTKGLDKNGELKESHIDWLGKIPKHWTVKRLKDFTTKIGSGVTPKGGADVYEDSGIPLFRSQNIHFDGLRLDDVAYISTGIHESMSGSKVETNDVLLNITGASIGRCYYYDGFLGEANVNQHVCVIRTNTKLQHRFLQFYLSSDSGQSQVFMGQVGTSREGLTFQDIKHITLGVPEVDEQIQIVKHLELRTKGIDHLLKNTEQQIEKLAELRKIKIYEAVTGKIKVPSYEQAIA